MKPGFFAPGSFAKKIHQLFNSSFLHFCKQGLLSQMKKPAFFFFLYFLT